jgi:hypothetical protein
MIDKYIAMLSSSSGKAPNPITKKLLILKIKELKNLTIIM